MSNEGPIDLPIQDDSSLVSDLVKRMSTPSKPGFSTFSSNQPSQMTYGSVFKNTFATENAIASYIKGKQFENQLGKFAEPDFDALNFIPPGYEHRADLFMLAQNRGDIDTIRNEIDREDNARLLKAQHPIGSFMSGFVANLVDPSILLPGGTIYKEAKAAQNAGRSALSIGRAAGVSTFLQEEALRSTQITREPEESFWNVFAAGIIGAGIGGLGGTIMSGPLGSKAVKEVSQVMNDGPMGPQPIAPRIVTDDGKLASGQGLTGPQGRAAGAQPTDLAALKQAESLWKIQPFVDKIPGFAPLFRMIKSPFLTSQEFVNSMVEHNYFTNKNFEGGGNVNLETRIKQRMRSLYASMTLSIRDGFYEQSGVKTKIPVVRDIASLTSDTGMSFNDWQFQLTRAFRNNGEHPNPKVRAVAQQVKKNIIDLLADESVALEMLPEGVTPETALGYITKIRDVQKIIQDHARPAAAGGQRYKGKLIQGLTENNNNLKSLMPQIDGLNKQIKGKKALSSEITKLQKKFNSVKKFGTANEKQSINLQKGIDSARKKIQTKSSKLKVAVSKKEGVVKELKEALDGLKVSPKGKTKKFIQENARKKQALLAKIKKANSDLAKEKKVLSEFKNGELKALEKTIREKESQLKKSKLSAKEINEIKQKIDANPVSAINAEIALLEKELEDLVPRKLKTKTKSGKLKIRKVMSDSEIPVAADQMIESFIGSGDDRFINPLLADLTSSKKSPDVFKSRTVMIDDLLEEEFLINDAELLLSHMIRGMVPVIELTKAAKNMGLESFSHMRSKVLQDLADEFNKSLQGKFGKAVADLETYKATQKMIDDLESKPSLNHIEKNQLSRLKDENKGKSLESLEKKVDKLEPSAGKEAVKLKETMESNINDMNAIFDINLGIYKAGFNVLDTKAIDFYRNIRDWNFSRFGGFMGLASIPEIFAHALKVGPMKQLEEGIFPAVREFFGGEKGIARTKQDALLRDLQYAVQSEMGTIQRTMLDGEGLGVRNSIYRRFFSTAAEITSEMSLIKKIQDLTERITGRIAISDILRNIDKATKGELDEFGNANLNRLGITSGTRKQIHDWWKSHGGIDDGAYWIDHTMIDANSTTKAEIYNIFRDSIVKELDSSVIKTGAGDKPLMARSNIGKLIFQFKDWSMGATTRLMLPGVQRNNVEFYSGSLFLLFGGLLSHLITQTLRGNEIDWSFDTLAIESIDRSGIAGLAMEGANILGKSLFGTGTTRYQSRGVVGAILGPSFDAPDQLLSMFNKAYQAANPDAPPLKTKDLEAAARLMPLQNMAWYYQLRQAAVKKAAIGLGLEE